VGEIVKTRNHYYFEKVNNDGSVCPVCGRRHFFFDFVSDESKKIAEASFSQNAAGYFKQRSFFGRLTAEL